MSISTIIKIFYFVGKRFSEMKKDDEDAMVSIAKELESELKKEDGFAIDVSYKEKVWRDFYQRGVIRNTISIMLFVFILSIVVLYLPFGIAKLYLIRVFKYFTKKNEQETSQDNLQEIPEETNQDKTH